MTRKQKHTDDAAAHKDAAAEKPATAMEEQTNTTAPDAEAVEATDAPGTPRPAAAEEAAQAVETSQDEDPMVAVRRERDELKDRLMRLAAEFDNFRKRTAREWQEHQKRATSEVLREMIELVDNFERALETAPEDAAGLRKGIELIHQQMVASLRKFGIEDISAEGMEFDPQKHEALMLVDSEDVDSQHVVQVIQKGYALHGEVLRPARVTVSR